MTLIRMTSRGLLLAGFTALAPAALTPAAVAQSGFQTSDQSELAGNESGISVTGGNVRMSDNSKVSTQQSNVTVGGSGTTLVDPGQSGISVTGGSMTVDGTSKLKPGTTSNMRVAPSGLKTSGQSKLKTTQQSKITVGDDDD